MPTYEYRCSKCKKEFEVVQRITDDPVKECTKCGGPVERLIAATNFILKGSGWYKSDYARPAVPSKAETPSCGTEKNKPSCQGCPAAKSG
ncbi:MAG: FmdB family zinc ribbon protein [bacterium]|nr:zinc ribbon domain-containing protein [bacterium]MDT8367059.1 FmdB family zinc ribbon protein [bacterium]